MCKVQSWRKTCLLVLFLLFHHHRRHTSYPNDVPARMMWHNDQFVMEATAPTAPMPTRMLIVILLEGYCRSPGTKLYIFLRISKPTTNPQHSLTRRDLNGRQRLSWYLTPDANADNSCPECWWIVVCGGTRSGAPWRPWEDSSRNGWWGTI
jgi:hypothetical protein